MNSTTMPAFPSTEMEEDRILKPMMRTPSIKKPCLGAQSPSSIKPDRTPSCGRQSRSQSAAGFSWATGISEGRDGCTLSRRILLHCVVSGAAGAILSAIDATCLNGRRYQKLSEGALANTAAAHDGSVDWARLGSINPEIEAWLSVKGAGIDLPVVRPSEDKRSDWYLRHDAWGRLSEIGCPYLDRRCRVSDRHVLVYGHRVGRSGLMFSELASMYRQEVFDQLECALWRTPTETTTFTPLFAMRTDRTHEGIQRFDHSSQSTLSRWASDLLNEASAIAVDAHARVACAERVLTLVTCSGRGSGGRLRTLVLFSAP